MLAFAVGQEVDFDVRVGGAGEVLGGEAARREDAYDQIVGLVVIAEHELQRATRLDVLRHSHNASVPVDVSIQFRLDHPDRRAVIVVAHPLDGEGYDRRWHAHLAPEHDVLLRQHGQSRLFDDGLVVRPTDRFVAERQFRVR